MRVAILSFADFQNYGDALFAFVIRGEIKRRLKNVEFKFFCPSYVQIEDISFETYSHSAMEAFKPDLILLAGGETVHKHDYTVWKNGYYKMQGKPSDCVFDWLDMDAYKAWLSVGVMFSNDSQFEASTNEVNMLDFCSTRGLLSKKILEHRNFLDNNVNIDISPDLGWLFPRHFDKSNSRISLPPENSYFCFTTFRRNHVDETEFEKSVLTCDRFARKNNLTSVFFEFKSSNGENKELISKILKQCSNTLYLDDLSYFEMYSVLARSRFYVGCSMHCAVTLLANKKPAAIIHPKPMTKLQDLFGHMMRMDLFRMNWSNLDSLLNKCYFFSEKEFAMQSKYGDFMQVAFDYKFSQILSLGGGGITMNDFIKCLYDKYGADFFNEEERCDFLVTAERKKIWAVGA